MQRYLHNVLICVFLASLVLAVFHPLTGHDFINMDDPFFVEKHGVPQGLTGENIKRAFTMTYGLWMPLTWLSHMADCHVFGLDPAGHHRTSLLIHLANTLLLFLALRFMTGAPWKSLITAGIFALHPLNVQPVAFIAARNGLLATFFGLLTLMAYTHYVHRPTVTRYLAVCLMFLLGLMAKPVLMPLPLVLLLLDYWPLNRISRETRLKREALLPLVREKLPLLAAAFLIGLVTIFTQQQAQALTPLAATPFSERTANALISYVLYLGQVFRPTDLAVFYPWPRELPWWKVLPAAALLLFLTAKTIESRLDAPYAPVGWLWFVIMLLPVIGFVRIGSHAMADRYAYLPGIGIFIIIVWSVASVTEKRRFFKPLLALGLPALFLLLGAWSRHHVGHWQNSATVFRQALAVTRDNYAAHNNLARALLEQGRTGEAREHLNQALEIQPEFSLAHNNLGVLLAAEGRTGQALLSFSKAIENHPDFAEAHYNMADTLFAEESYTRALTHYRRTLEIEPDYPRAAEIHHRIGLIMKARTRPRDAEEHFQKTLALDPGHIETANQLTAIYRAEERYEEAITMFRRLLEARPDCRISITYNLASLYAQINDPETALAWLEQSLAAGFRFHDLLETDPNLDNLRDTPGYRRLTERLSETNREQ